MATSVVIQGTVEIPLDLASLDAFRRWSLSDGFPDRGRIDFVRGRIEVDMSPADLFSHGTLKTEFRVYQRGESAFELVTAGAGRFWRSSVLGCWFRLDRRRNERGHWAFDLRTREPA